MACNPSPTGSPSLLIINKMEIQEHLSIASIYEICVKLTCKKVKISDPSQFLT